MDMKNIISKIIIDYLEIDYKFNIKNKINNIRFIYLEKYILKIVFITILFIIFNIIFFISVIKGIIFIVYNIQ